MATILIVDDEPVNREFLVTLLGYGGHRLLEASDGAEALERVRAERPDLVITDILMPTMDGYELVRQLRADPSVADTRVIFYTAHFLEREARNLAAACGIAQILTKPCEPEVVLNTVAAALGDVEAAVAPPEAFDREHLRLLTDKLSAKVEELQTANARLEALIDLGHRLGTERDPERLVEGTCVAARDIIGAKFAALGLLENGGSELGHFFVAGIERERGARLAVPALGGVLRTITFEGQTVRLRHLDGSPEAVGLPRELPPVHSFAGAPIASLTRIYGWLCVTEKLGSEEFSLADERLLRILAAQLGRTYENGSLYREIARHASQLEAEIVERRNAEQALRRYTQRLQFLVDIDHAILAQEAPRQIAQVAIAQLRQLLQCARISVSLFDAQTAELSMLAVDGLATDPRLMPGDRLLVEEFSGIGILRQGEIFRTADCLAADAPVLAAREQALVDAGLRSIVKIPLIAGSHLIGSLNLGATRPQAFDVEQVEIAGEVANHLAVSVQQARLAEEVQEHARELETRVQDRTAALMTANKELESFSYSVSHDLRAPLRSIDGFSRALLEDYRDQLNADAQGYLARIRYNTTRMNELIEDLLKLAQVASSALRRAPVDLSALARSVVAELRRADPQRQIEVSVADGLTVEGDPHLLRVVLDNLLGNAWKYTRKQTSARIEVGRTTGENHLVVHFVRDSGVGFDMAHAENLFGAFQRLHAASEFEGTGVGLATVQRIIHRHGGRIWAEAAVGAGATFYFTLGLSASKD